MAAFNSDVDHDPDSLSRAFLAKCSFGAAGTNHTFAQFRGTPNEDRFSVSEEWELGGHVWQFLAVFDGHGGPTTAEYLSKTFPSHIRASMEQTFSDSGSAFAPSPAISSASTLQSPSQSRANSSVSVQLQTSPAEITPTTATATFANINGIRKDEDIFSERSVSEFLKRQVRAFDDELGNAVKAICPNPEQLVYDMKAAETLYKANRDVITRARCGSTMAGILVDKTPGKKRMWVCCVGDSSVVLSTKQADSKKRKSILLNKHHTGQTPIEYHRVTLEHPSHERDDIWLDGEERIFGTLSMTRAFGDFMYKFPRSFTSALFSHVPSTANKSVESVLRYNRTPPYVIADPHVSFMDLEKMRIAVGSQAERCGDVEGEPDLAVVIYSDGLEALAYRLALAVGAKADGQGSNKSSPSSTPPRSPSPPQQSRSVSMPSPVDVIGALVAQPRAVLRDGSFAESTDGFPRYKSNEAFDLMYNVLVRAIPGKLRTHLLGTGEGDQGGAFAWEESYVDDVTVMVFRPFPHSPSR